MEKEKTIKTKYKDVFKEITNDTLKNLQIIEENTFCEYINWSINVYINYNKTKKIIWEAIFDWNTLLWITTINDNLDNYIKWIWTYIIFKILNRIEWNCLIIPSILDDTLWFYQKVASRFKEKWYIKKYEFKNNNTDLILYKK